MVPHSVSVHPVDGICAAAALMMTGVIVARSVAVLSLCSAAGHLTLSTLADRDTHARLKRQQWLKFPMAPHHPKYNAAWEEAIANQG